MDHPGIVYQISAVLSSLGINIESMETKTYSAPVSGTPIFQLEANLAVPTRTNINQLRQRFSEIQREENIDIELSPRQKLATSGTLFSFSLIRLLCWMTFGTTKTARTIGTLA